MADEMKSEPLTPELEKALDEKMNKFMEASRVLGEALEETRIQNEAAANQFWDNLSYEDKCNAFHAVVSRLVDGDIKKKGTYRYVLYDVFGFGPEMYVRGMDCGYMALHNSIDTDD